MSTIEKFIHLFNALTALRTFIRRSNGSSGDFLYGFWTFRAFSAWSADWFGETSHRFVLVFGVINGSRQFLPMAEFSAVS